MGNAVVVVDGAGLKGKPGGLAVLLLHQGAVIGIKFRRFGQQVTVQHIGKADDPAGGALANAGLQDQLLGLVVVNELTEGERDIAAELHRVRGGDGLLVARACFMPEEAGLAAGAHLAFHLDIVHAELAVIVRPVRFIYRAEFFLGQKQDRGPSLKCPVPGDRREGGVGLGVQLKMPDTAADTHEGRERRHPIRKIITGGVGGNDLSSKQQYRQKDR